MPRWTKEQESAISLSGSNIIVSAGAGSGKTAVLSERVIHKIEEGIHVNELLILTFTKAAAMEMKDRIRRKISENAKYKDELNLLNSAYITTFDSFALSVVKKYHYLLNIDDDIKITDSSLVSSIKRRIFDDVFEDMYRSNNSSFNEFVSKYCVKNDKALRENILLIASKIEGYVDADDFINRAREYTSSTYYVNKIVSKYEEVINHLKKLVSFSFENMKLYFDSDYISSVEKAISGILNCSLDELCLYTNVSLPNVPRGSSDDAKDAKASLKKAVDKLVSYSVYGNVDDICRDIFSNASSVNVILDIVSKYLYKIDEYKSKNGIYTFNDIAKLSIKLLKDNFSVREELKGSFKEIMIDEYQDTNDVQESFISMISNDNVYMVGDIKQAIYRFRGSNPDIFKDKYSKYANSQGGKKIDLIKNFRSRNEVLDNINKIFCLLMDFSLGDAFYSKDHQMVYGNTMYDDCKMDGYDYNFRVLEYVNDYKSSGYTNIEVEIFTIAKDIKSKIDNGFMVFDKDSSVLRKATYDDFVIILDRSKYFDLFKKVFLYLNIPLTILRDGYLNTSSDVLIFKNIVDFIVRIAEAGKSKDKNLSFNDDVGFKYDFISIARSFLYEYSDSYIFDVVSSGKYMDTGIYKDLSSIACDIYNTTSSNVFDKILEVTDFYNKLNKVGDYAETDVRMATIYSLTESLGNLEMSIYDFRDYLDDIVCNGDKIKYTTFGSDRASVKILTIHKSKGLEYPVCYFADLDHDFNASELKDRFICDYDYGVIVSSSEDDDRGSVLKEVYKYSYNYAEVSEKIRLFYVALTRAREQMILVVPYKDVDLLEKNEDGVIESVRRMAFNRLSSFVYGVKGYLSSYFESVNVDDIGLSKEYLYPVVLENLSLGKMDDDFCVDEVSVACDVLRREHFSKEVCEVVSSSSLKMLEYGRKIHEILEFLDFKDVDFSLISDEFILGKLKMFFDSDLLLDVLNAKVYKEYEFVYVCDGVEKRGVIDLMLCYDDYIDIIDYKLKNVVDDGYKRQIRGYVEYVRGVSGKCVKAYLYSILDGEFVSV